VAGSATTSYPVIRSPSTVKVRAASSLPRGATTIPTAPSISASSGEAGGGDSLLRGTQLVVISARGGAYGPGTRRQARDFFTPYLRAHLLKQGAVEGNIHFAIAELTLATSFRTQADDSLAAKTEVDRLVHRGTAAVSYSGSTRGAHDA